MFHFVSCMYSDCIFILYFNTFSDDDVLFILTKTEKLLITQVAVFISVYSCVLSPHDTVTRSSFKCHTCIILEI